MDWIVTLQMMIKGYKEDRVAPSVTADTEQRPSSRRFTPEQIYIPTVHIFFCNLKHTDATCINSVTQLS